MKKGDREAEKGTKLRKSIHYCQPVGDEYFAQLIDEKYGIKVGMMDRGRPRRIEVG